MTYQDAYEYPDDGYTDGAPPDHSAGFPMRRPRLWHALALGAAGAWMLSMLIGVGGKCDSLAARPAPTPDFSSITTTSISPPSTVLEKPGHAGGYDQCAAAGDAWDRVECGVALGVIVEPPQLAQRQRALAAAESATSSAVASANSAAAKQEAELNACMGKRGSTGGTLQLVALALALGSLVTGWRRAKVYTRHKRDCALVSDFARKYPDEHLELAPNDALEVVIDAGYAASAEAFGQRVHWFGGDPDEDTERAYWMKDVASAASQERQRRLGGGWAPGMGGDDLPAPKLPPETTQTAAPSGGSDWRAKLAATDEDW